MIVTEVAGDSTDQNGDDIPVLMDNLEYIMKKIFNSTQIKEVAYEELENCKHIFDGYYSQIFQENSWKKYSKKSKAY